MYQQAALRSLSILILSLSRGKLMKKIVSTGVATLAAFLSLAAQANEDIQISGFGSLVGGVILDGDGYFARMPDAAGQYSDGFEFKTESRVGVQANYHIKSDLNLTGQVMIRGANDFDPELEWLYLTYDLTPNTFLKIGQMRLPVFHYSDYMDVGVAFPWLRIPTDAYSLAFTNYQGANLDINFDFGEVTSQLRVYAGQEDTDPNKLITAIEQYKTEQRYNDSGVFQGVRGIRTTKDYRDLIGVVLDNQMGNWGLRLSYLDGREKFTFYDEGDYPSQPLFGGEWVDTQFFDVSLQYDNGDVLVKGEWNDYDNIYTSWFVTLAYRFDKWTPYVFYSNFEGVFRFIAPGGIRNGFEDSETGSLDDDYNSVGVGARYDLTATTALKFELLTFNDEGDAAVYIDKDRDGDTDSTSLFVALDFSF